MLANTGGTDRSVAENLDLDFGESRSRWARRGLAGFQIE